MCVVCQPPNSRNYRSHFWSSALLPEIRFQGHVMDCSPLAGRGRKHSHQPSFAMPSLVSCHRAPSVAILLACLISNLDTYIVLIVKHNLFSFYSALQIILSLGHICIYLQEVLFGQNRSYKTRLLRKLNPSSATEALRRSLGQTGQHESVS